ncbi:hypothetical protein [uncultured Roseibium sp.]|nr:hypothetical protein [uncultured Roseibium sp.]
MARAVGSMGYVADLVPGRAGIETEWSPAAKVQTMSGLGGDMS